MNADRKMKARVHPLDAVPMIPEDVEQELDSRSRLEIRRPRPYPKGWRGRLAQRMRIRRDVRLNLDERGGFFWSRIDGHRSLAKIARELRREFSLSDQESRDATVKFTQTLMLRGVICLMPNGAAEAGRSTPLENAKDEEVSIRG